MRYSIANCLYIVALLLILMIFVYGAIGLLCGCGNNRGDENFLLPFYKNDTLLLELSGYNFGSPTPSTTPNWYRLLDDGRGIGILPAQYFADTDNLKSWFIFSKDQITNVCNNQQDDKLLLQLGTDIMPVVRDVIKNKQLTIYRHSNEEGWWIVELD